MLYSQADELNCARKLRVSFWICLSALVVTAALMVAALVVRWQMGATVVCALGVSLTYFFWNTQGLPWYRYRRFLQEMESGMRRKTTGRFVYVSDAEREQDGVTIRDFFVEIEGQQEEILFYWDIEKPLPQLESGQQLALTSFGKFIVELTAE